MTNQQEEEQNVADALRRSEELRLALEQQENAVRAATADNNGNFTISINVGARNNSNSNTAGEQELRQRRPETTNNASNQQQAPVHARTIDRFPNASQNNQGQEEAPQNPRGLVQHVHIQRNPNGRQTIRVRRGVGSQQGAAGATEQDQLNSTRRIRIPLRSGQGIRVTTGNESQQLRLVNTRGNQQIARVQVPPLQPQPLPFHGTHTSSTSGDESSEEQQHEDQNEFKCLICFEFLQNPASCGKCASRFCHACIIRVATSATGNAPAKCPACRREFGRNDIVYDTDLRDRMQRANAVTCQYDGCNAQLALSQVAAHEQTCLFVPVKCRFATFGCEWKGIRKTLAEHEAMCPLMQVSGLVEQFRETRANNEHAITHLQSRVAASNAMMELHASMLRRLQSRSYHPGDLLDLVYTVTCTPARFIYTKDTWRTLTGCRLQRGFLCNVLVFLPIALAMLRLAATGYREFLLVADDLNTIEMADHLVEGLSSLIILLLFVLLLVIFVKLGKSSVEWKSPSGNRWEGFLMESCAGLACLIVSATLINSRGQGFVWISLCLTSTVFPSFVLSMIEAVTGLNRTRPTNLFTVGRAVPIMLFGVRYGLILYLAGFVSFMDAVMIQSALREKEPERMVNYVAKDDCMFTSIPNQQRLAYFSLRALLIMVDPGMLMNSFFAAIVLLLINFIVNNLVFLGDTFATFVCVQAQANLLPNNAGIRKVCNVWGSLLFVTWLSLLGCVALSYK